MTDPSDVKKPWPDGLKSFLEKLGAKSLVDAMKKKNPKPLQKVRKPYAEIDPDQEPEF